MSLFRRASASLFTSPCPNVRPSTPSPMSTPAHIRHRASTCHSNATSCCLLCAPPPPPLRMRVETLDQSTSHNVTPSDTNVEAPAPSHLRTPALSVASSPTAHRPRRLHLARLPPPSLSLRTLLHATRIAHRCSVVRAPSSTRI